MNRISKHQDSGNKELIRQLQPLLQNPGQLPSQIRRLRALEAVEDTCAVTMEKIYAVYGGEGDDATNATLF